MTNGYFEGEDAFAGDGHEGGSVLSLGMGLVAGMMGLAMAPLAMVRALTAVPVVLSTERTFAALSAIWPTLPPARPVEPAHPVEHLRAA